MSLKEDCNKIRKRGSSSSSSSCSSSAVRNYHLKRAILEGKKFRPLLLQLQPSNFAVEKNRDNRRRNMEKIGNSDTPHKQTETKAYDSLKSRLKEVRNMLVASKELLKALSHRICFQEQLEPSRNNNNNNNKPIVSALRFELDRARVQMDQLIEEDRFKQNDLLLLQFNKEKAEEEEERISKAMLSMAGEIEVEKKLRRQRERLNKSLGKELADMKAHLAKAVEDLEKEKRAKEALERKCNDLIVGAEVLEELTREESARTTTCEEEDDDVFGNSCRNHSEGMEDNLDEVERYLKDHILFGSNSLLF